MSTSVRQLLERESSLVALKLRHAAALVQGAKAQALFYHVHKSGGTALCEAVAAAGKSLLSCDSLRAVRKRGAALPAEALRCNCNGCTTHISPLAGLTTGGVSDFFRNHSEVEVFFVESGVLPAPVTSDNVLQIVTLRDPVHRFISHVLHLERYSNESRWEAISRNSSAVADLLRGSMRALDTDTHTCEFYHKDYHVPDNFITRFLVGKLIPTDQGCAMLGPADLTRAISVLANMTAVFVLEELGAAGDALDGLGLARVTEHAGSSASLGVDYTQLFTADEWQALERRHHLDMAVYAYARQLHRLHVGAWALGADAQRRSGQAGKQASFVPRQDLPLASSRAFAASNIEQLLQRESSLVALKLRRAAELVQAGRSQTIFYHIHKSGGSAACSAVAMAGKSLLSCDGLRAVQKRGAELPVDALRCNCNGCTSRASSLAMWSAGDELLRRRADVEVFFVESGMPPTPITNENVLHVATLRHPVHRFISHVLHAERGRHRHHLNESWWEANQRNRSAVAQVLRGALADYDNLAGGPTDNISDNFITRFLVGKHILTDQGCTMLGPADLTRAISVLANMTAVFVLEELGAAGDALDGLGLARVTEHAGSSASLGVDYTQLFTADEWQALERRHHLDMAVYAYARQLHRLHVGAWALGADAQRRSGENKPG